MKRQKRTDLPPYEQFWKSNVDKDERNQAISGKGNQLCRRCLLPNENKFEPIKFLMLEKEKLSFKNKNILPQIYAVLCYFTFCLDKEKLEEYQRNRFRYTIESFIKNLPKFIQTFDLGYTRFQYTTWKETRTKKITDELWKETDEREAFESILSETKRAYEALVRKYGDKNKIEKGGIPKELEQLQSLIESGIITEDFSDGLWKNFKVAYIPHGGHVYFNTNYIEDIESIEKEGTSTHVEKHSWYFDEKREGVIFVGGIRKYWGVDKSEQVKGVGTHLFSCLIQHLQSPARKHPLRFLEIFPSFDVTVAQEKNLIKNFALFNPLNRRVYTFYGLTDVALYLSRRKDYKEEAKEWLDTIYAHKYDWDDYDEDEDEDEDDYVPGFFENYQKYKLQVDYLDYLDEKNSSLLVCAGLCLYLKKEEETQNLTLDIFRLNKEEYKSIEPKSFEAEKINLKKQSKNNWIQCSCKVQKAAGKNKFVFVVENNNFELEGSSLKRLYEWLRVLASLVFCRYHLDLLGQTKSTASLDSLEIEYDDGSIGDLPAKINTQVLHQKALKMESYLSPLTIQP